MGPSLRSTMAPEACLDSSRQIPAALLGLVAWCYHDHDNMVIMICDDFITADIL